MYRFCQTFSQVRLNIGRLTTVCEVPGCQAGRVAAGTAASANIFVHRLLFFFFAFPLPPADIKNRNSPRSNLKFRFDKLSHGSSSSVGASGSCGVRRCLPCPATGTRRWGSGGLGLVGLQSGRWSPLGQGGEGISRLCPLCLQPDCVRFFIQGH